jgi:hypothetical protein
MSFDLALRPLLFASRLTLTPLLFVSQRLFAWWTQKSIKDQLLESLGQARLFEEWEGAAFQLDEVLGYDLWYASFQNERDQTGPTCSLLFQATESY